MIKLKFHFIMVKLRWSSDDEMMKFVCPLMTDKVALNHDEVKLMK